MSAFEQGEVRIEIIQGLRSLAERGADIPEIVAYLQDRLGLEKYTSLFPALAYFRAAFYLSLREALPLREWLAGKDRSEVDSILIPAMQRTKEQWHSKQLQGV